jgi:hypothetical protein
MKITHKNLQGSWIVAGSEIEHLKTGDEIYHFIPPDCFIMEFKLPNGQTDPRSQQYQLTDEGSIFGSEDNLRCPVTAWLESGFLIFRPNHGMETWSTRLKMNITEILS